MCIDITGNFFYVVNSNNLSDTFDVKFNETREPPFTLVRMMGFYTPFYRFFITNTAQANAFVEIIYGTLARPFLDIIDNRSEALTNELLQDILDELVDLTDQTEYLYPVAASTMVNADASQGGAGTSIIYTVPAGNTLHITAGFLDSYVTGATLCELRVRDNLAAKQYALLAQEYPVAIKDDSKHGSICFPAAVIVPATWDVAIFNSNAAGNSNGGISGWLT